MPTRVRLAWGLAALSLVLAVVDTVFTGLHTSLLGRSAWIDHGWPMIALTTASCSVMGALVVSRYPRNPIGWLLIVAGMSSISIACEGYSFWALEPGGHGPALAGHVTGWASNLFGAPLAMTGVLIIFLIAPDGQFLSRRWRWVAIVAVSGLAIYTSFVAAISPTTFVVNKTDVGPGLSALAGVGIVMMVGSLVASTVCLAIRLRRARGDARRQLLWIAASAAWLATAFVWYLVDTAVNGSDQAGVPVLFLYFAYLSLPVCIAVAVLRHRLLDIDVIVNRALVVFLATALVSAAYVLLVVAFGSVLGDYTSFWPSLLATALVALAFQPLRRWVVRVADRLAFGAAAEPYDALAEFSRRLGESSDPAALLPAIADAAATAVGARRTTVSLALPFEAHRFVSWPAGSSAGSGPTADFPVVDDGEVLGSVRVEMAPGRPLRPADNALLGDLADQAVVAFRNARLSAELAHRVAELDRHAHALEESRRRLITAGDAERSRLERAVTREVAPHLQALPDRLETLAADATVTADQVRALRADAEQALEALREITRGVYPAQLERTGLVPAVRSLVARVGESTLTVDAPEDIVRRDARVEAAAYFCIAEAVRGLTGPLELSLQLRDDELRARVVGRNGDELPLDTMRDRAEALGGTISRALDGDRLTVQLSIPAQALRVPQQREVVELRDDAQPVAAAQAAASQSGPNSDLVT